MSGHRQALRSGRPIRATIRFSLVGLMLVFCLVARAAPTQRTSKETLSIADALMAQGMQDSARVILRSALKSDSMNVDLWLRLAKVERKRGRASARSNALNRVFRLSPRTVEGRIELVPDLLDRNRTDSALVMAKQAVALGHAIDPLGWYWLGRAYQLSAQFDSASAAFQQAYKLLGDDTY